MSIWDFIGEHVDLKAMADYKIYSVKDGEGLGYSDIDDDAAKAFLCGMVYAIGRVSDYDHTVHECPESMESVKSIVEDIRRTAIDDAAEYADCWALSALNDILYNQANEEEKESENDEEV